MRQPDPSRRKLWRGRFFRRLELATLAALVLIWAGSIFCWPCACWSTSKGMRSIDFASGGVDIFHYPDSSLPGALVCSAPRAGTISVLWWPRRITPIGGFGLSVPLWFLFPLPLIPGAARLARYVLTPGHRCRNCRYDLRGLDAARPCPECGETRAAILRAQLQAGS